VSTTTIQARICGLATIDDEIKRTKPAFAGMFAVEVTIPEAYIPHLRIGDVLTVTVPDTFEVRP
jgi:hypothetical protein